MTCILALSKLWCFCGFHTPWGRCKDKKNVFQYISAPGPRTDFSCMTEGLTWGDCHQEMKNLYCFQCFLWLQIALMVIYQMVLALRSLLSERGGAEQWISIFLKHKRMQNVSLDEMSWGLKIPMSSSAGFFLWTIICHWAWDVISFVLKFLRVFQSGTVWVSYSHTPVTTHHRLSFLSISADCLRWPTMGYQIFWRTHEVIGDIYTLQHIITEEAQSECASFVFCTSLDI